MCKQCGTSIKCYAPHMDLAMCNAQALAEEVHARQAPNEAVLAEERKKKNYVEFYAVISLKDPFRLVLSEMRDRLFHTREILHHCLVHCQVRNVLLLFTFF